MADPDNDPNAQPDLESDAQPAPPPAPYQPPGNPYPHKPTRIGPANLSAPRQTPAQDFGQQAEGHTAPLASPPEPGPTPTALP